MSMLVGAKPVGLQARRARVCARRVRPVRAQDRNNVKVEPAVQTPAIVKTGKLPQIKKSTQFVEVLVDRIEDTLEDAWLKCPIAPQGRHSLKPSTDKPRVLVLGSGWAAHSFIKTINCDQYEVVVVSPRNYFLFTPMLPSTAVGSVEFRSVLDPIRSANPKVQYIEASCDALDVKRKVAVCTSQVAFVNGQQPRFELPYDTAVVAVGEKPATFGVPGVEENCFFMKEINDAVRLRNRIAECFELASLPGCTPEEREKALHFVVVGGGPTGVEFAGTLIDFVSQDLKKKYPELMQYTKVTLLEATQAILTQFDRQLGEQAMNNLKSTGVEVRLGIKVVGVTEDYIELGSGEKIPYGVAVWSAGNAVRSLVKDIAAQIPEQAAVFRSKLTVDDFMRIEGAEDVIALGDCSVMLDRLPPTAQVAAQQGNYAARLLNKGFSLGRGGQTEAPPSRVMNEQPASNQAQLPAGAGSAAEVVAEVVAPRQVQVEYCERPFQFLNLGMLAYVGNDKALVQAQAGPMGLRLYGSLAYVMWQSVYIAKQVSLRNRVMIMFDWMKAKLFGRDISQL